jgi:hypothetical protein
MALVKSQTNNLKSIFNSNRFIIPEYQRKYSWSLDEREALWNDIAESVGVMHHFIGTFAFKACSDSLSIEDTYDVIDGQQRITTIYILLSVLIDQHPDDNWKNQWRNSMIGSKSNLKLTPLGVDGSILEKVLFEFNTLQRDQLKTRSQRNLYDAKKEFLALVSPLKTAEEIQNHISFIVNDLEVLVFNVDNDAQAVKMFSVINDRGLPLSILDKTKSTLMYYSTIRLDGKCNHQINTLFGEIFDAYDAIELLREELDILGQFSENTLYNQHYYTQRALFKNDWNYKIGSEEIFKSLKRMLKQSEFDEIALQEFILRYTQNLRDFTIAFKNLLSEVDKIDAYQKPFLYLGFTATMYPFIVKLYQQGLLQQLLSMLEKIEVRVYKLKGTNPRQSMYDFASRLEEQPRSESEVREWLTWFVDHFMNDLTFKKYLSENIYRNAAVKYILAEYNDEPLSLSQYNDLQKEHIFPTSATFDVTQHGFIGRDEYLYDKDCLGNLTLLEKVLNIKADNDPPITKVPRYLESNLVKTRELGGSIKMAGINKTRLETRREEIITFCVNHFDIRKDEVEETL